MELKNRSFQYGKVALAVRTQHHQLQFVLKVVAICTYICMSFVQTVSFLLLPDCRSSSVNLLQKSVQCWTRPVLVRKFVQQLSGTVTLTLPWNFDQYSVLFSINHCSLRQPNASQKNITNIMSLFVTLSAVSMLISILHSGKFCF